jgi:hypothetical protein
MANAGSAESLFPVCGVKMMKRRDFLQLLLLGIFTLFGRKAKAGKKPENTLKEAMFWRKVD